MQHITTKEKHFHIESKGIALITVLIFLFFMMSIALLFFFRNTIISMREFREKERQIRVYYGKNAAWSMAFSKLENYFFSPSMWLQLKEPHTEFPSSPEENNIGKNFFQFTISEKNKPLPIRYRIEPIQQDSTSIRERLVYRISSQVWDGNKWSFESSRDIEILRMPIYDFLIVSSFDLELFTTKRFIADAPIYAAGNIYIASNDTMYLLSNIYSPKELYYGKKERYVKKGQIYIHNGKSLQELNSYYDSVEEFEDFQPLDLADSVSPDGKPYNKQTWRESQAWYEISTNRFNGKVRLRMNGMKPAPLPPQSYYTKDGLIYKKSGVHIIVRIVTDSVFVQTGYEKICRKHTYNPDSTGGCGYYDKNNPCCEWDSILVLSHYKKTKKLAVELEDSAGEKIKGSGKPFTFTTFFDPVMEKNVFALEINIFELQSRIQSNNEIYYVTYSPELQKKDTVLAVRLFECEFLQAPLFLSTDFPLYIKGNFNRHCDGTGRSLDPRKDDSFEQDRWKPAIIVAKSITLLSSNYSDDKAFDYSKRIATDTEYSFIAITGCPVTFKSDTGIVYGGGFENTLRLVENWKNSNLFFWGTICTFWQREDNSFKIGPPFFEPPFYIVRAEPYLSKMHAIPEKWAYIIPQTTIGVRFLP